MLKSTSLVLPILTSLLWLSSIAISQERRFDRDALESRFSSDVFGFTSRKGFQSRYGYRIPSVVVTESDVVLAIVERRHGLGDHAGNDIVLRRSEDGGRTWGDVIVIDERGDHCLCNPCAVLLPDTGRVLIMYQDYAPDRHSVDIPHQRVKRVVLKYLIPPVKPEDKVFAFIADKF